MNEHKIYSIGDLAKETSEETSTLRVWIKKGLLYSVMQTVGGVFLFDESSVKRVKKIRKLKDEEHLTLKGVKLALEEK